VDRPPTLDEHSSSSASRGVVAEFAARDAQHAADLAGERALTEKAIAAFSALAERIDAFAAGRTKPWWRRLVG
jgi:hypothetical protein